MSKKFTFRVCFESHFDSELCVSMIYNKAFSSLPLRDSFELILLWNFLPSCQASILLALYLTEGVK